MIFHVVTRCAWGAAPVVLAFPALPATAQTPALPPGSPTVACPNPQSLSKSAPHTPIQVAALHDTSSR